MQTVCTLLQTDDHTNTSSVITQFLQTGCCFSTQPTVSKHTHTRLTAIFPGLPRGAGRYQKGKTNLDFTEARDSEWQWHQPGHMQVCTSLQTDNHASTSPLSFFTGLMPFLPPNQQRQSTEGKFLNTTL